MSAKPYLYFIKNVIWINFGLSCFFALLTTDLVSDSRHPLLTAFSFCFITCGYALTIMIFHFFSKRTRYLYFNLGVSLLRLYLFGFIFNLLIIFALNLAAHIV